MKIYFLIATVVSFFACSTVPEKINFGSDQCSYCKMNIVDKLHVSQMVTKKGKQYKYDAIECMVNHLHEFDENEIATTLVSDYGNNGKMVDAKNAFYLISPNIKSPMGANLSAFGLETSIQKFQKEKSGEILTWEELLTQQ